MGRNQGRVSEGSDIPEAAFIDVRDVHDDAQSVARPHQLFAEVRQPGAGVRRVREQVWNSFTEIVGSTPDRAQRTQSGGIEKLQCVEPRIDGFGALEVDDRGQHAVLQTRAQLVERAHHADLALRVTL